MLTKWLHKVLPRKSARRGKRREISLAQHHIQADDLSFAAEKVITRLQKEGYQAYVVGGAVRDLLLGVTPKDFDVATDATPEQIHKLFRRSRIIGKRFPIVHVMVGPETIEVTTFRGGAVNSHNELGRIMKDVSFGTLEQDAMRRDFTANALYYDPKQQVVLDFHHGVEDILNRRLVMIGNPAERYQEDPVRMLRAARLSGKLGFTVDKHTSKPIAECAQLLKREPPARLFDEVLKILFSGYAQACLRQINNLGLKDIHPLLDALMPGGESNDNIVALALHNTDERLRADKSVSMGFVLAAVLWPHIRTVWQRELNNGMRSSAAMNAAITSERQHVDKNWGVPQRYSVTMREIWSLQPQFEIMRGARPYRLLGQPRFRAAFDFMCLRASLGELSQETVQWWQAFQHGSDVEREQLIRTASQSEKTSTRQKRYRNRRTNKPKQEEA